MASKRKKQKTSSNKINRHRGRSRTNSDIQYQSRKSLINNIFYSTKQSGNNEPKPIISRVNSMNFNKSNYINNEHYPMSPLKRNKSTPNTLDIHSKNILKDRTKKLVNHNSSDSVNKPKLRNHESLSPKQSSSQISYFDMINPFASVSSKNNNKNNNNNNSGINRRRESSHSYSNHSYSNENNKRQKYDYNDNISSRMDNNVIYISNHPTTIDLNAMDNNNSTYNNNNINSSNNISTNKKKEKSIKNQITNKSKVGTVKKKLKLWETSMNYLNKNKKAKKKKRSKQRNPKSQRSVSRIVRNKDQQNGIQYKNKSSKKRIQSNKSRQRRHMKQPSQPYKRNRSNALSKNKSIMSPMPINDMLSPGSNKFNSMYKHHNILKDRPPNQRKYYPSKNNDSLKLLSITQGLKQKTPKPKPVTLNDVGLHPYHPFHMDNVRNKRRESFSIDSSAVDGITPRLNSVTGSITNTNVGNSHRRGRSRASSFSSIATTTSVCLIDKTIKIRRNSFSTVNGSSSSDDDNIVNSCLVNYFTVNDSNISNININNNGSNNVYNNNNNNNNNINIYNSNFNINDDNNMIPSDNDDMIFDINEEIISQNIIMTQKKKKKNKPKLKKIKSKRRNRVNKSNGFRTKKT